MALGWDKSTVGIDYGTIDDLGIRNGDPIEVGNTVPLGEFTHRSRICKVSPLYSSDEGKGVIRLSGYVQHLIGVNTGAMVKVRKVSNFKNADKVFLAVLKDIPPVSEGYVKSQLLGEYVRKRQLVHVHYFGGLIGPFEVIAHVPDDCHVVRITDKTLCHVVEGTEIVYMNEGLNVNSNGDESWYCQICNMKFANKQEYTDHFKHGHA